MMGDSRKPYVLINVAATVDGKIDTIERRGAVISGEADRERVQRLRASVDAIMVGTRTLVEEDPRLTVRSEALQAERVARGLAPNPTKVTLVRDVALLRADSRFVSDGPARIVVFVPRGTDTARAPESVEVIAVGPVGAERVDLQLALRQLAQIGIRSMLVEGGGTLNFELLRLGLVDEVQLYLAPIIFGGASAPTPADGGGLPRDLAIRLTRTHLEPQDDGGLVLRYKVEAS
jgi:2,5-diamino-6-(ribosylamino)-4(3H)-pyrimidinone 5'-phosphate reductase